MKTKRTAKKNNIDLVGWMPDMCQKFYKSEINKRKVKGKQILKK